MLPPAPKTVGGCVVVAYTAIDERHRPTGGCRHVVAGVLQGPAAGLAICECERGRGYYLFGCDGHWNSVTDSWFPTVREAMDQAEFEYEGATRTWLNHDPAWEPLPDDEEQAVWDLFYERFRFRPGVDPSTWPGIEEPTPSVTFDISDAFQEAQLPANEAELNAEMVAAFRWCVTPGGRLYALDWQHQCYWFNPFGRFEFSPVYSGMIPVVPDGDYHIFLADDFRFGTFGHPWEQTICVFGSELLAAVERERPRVLRRPVRRNGVRI